MNFSEHIYNWFTNETIAKNIVNMENKDFCEHIYNSFTNETIAKNIINMENKDFCYIKQEVKNLGRVKVAQFPTAVKCLMNFLYSFIGL